MLLCAAAEIVHHPSTQVGESPITDDILVLVCSSSSTLLNNSFDKPGYLVRMGDHAPASVSKSIGIASAPSAVNEENQLPHTWSRDELLNPGTSGLV
jgi:hypothetical protein